jgi:hypothetical protein
MVFSSIRYNMAFLLWLLAATTTAADSQQVFAADSSPWLRAIGKLQVPGTRPLDGRRSHYIEDCSATLIAPTLSRSANTIVTAWHCLEFYSDLSKPITFTLVDIAGNTIQREAYQLADGGGMHADWALLRLYRAVASAQVTALTVHPGQADQGRTIIMAGYSKNRLPANDGQDLSFDPACSIIHQGQDISDTDCSAHKGASGGPVIQLTVEGHPLLCGVISEGNGEGRSTFVPVSGFRNAANLHLH